MDSGTSVVLTEPSIEGNWTNTANISLLSLSGVVAPLVTSSTGFSASVSEFASVDGRRRMIVVYLKKKKES